MNLKETIELVKHNAYMIKKLGMQNTQEVLDYEDEINKYSTIDYNKIGEPE